MKKQDTPKRAAGYGRTSGQGQKDNTSIPRQKADIEKFCLSNNFQLIDFYVDESKTGSKIDGRDSFKRMMQDAANDKFDIIIVYDIDRFARDGADIIEQSKLLKTAFGIGVIDIKGRFDTRNPNNTLVNYLFAGLSENERLTIMRRTTSGKIARAKSGLPWSAVPPAGRKFISTGKHSGYWEIDEKGHKLQKLLPRYANGESMKNLCQEFGFNPVVICRNINESQLSGTYHAQFNAPDIEIVNLKVPVPAIPQVITPELDKRVKERLLQNRRWNKQFKMKYYLTGFIKCGHCGKALIGQSPTTYGYYRHYSDWKESGCHYSGLRVDLIEPFVLDYLYSFFLDEPAYQEAIKTALPSNDDRQALVNDIQTAEKQSKAVNKEISYLVNAIAKGADISLLLDKQAELKAQKQILESRISELQHTLATLPDPVEIKQKASMLRWKLMSSNWGKDWRKLPFEEVRRFLHFLFSDNPCDNGFGIFFVKQNNQWEITFKGLVEFQHDVVDGKPVFSSRFTPEEIEVLAAQLESKQQSRKKIDSIVKEHDTAVEQAGKLDDLIRKANEAQHSHKAAKADIKRLKQFLEPFNDY